MSQGQTTIHHRANGEEVDEPLRSVIVHADDQSGPRIRLPIRALLLPLAANWPLLLLGLLIGPLLVTVSQRGVPMTYSAAALVVPNRTRTQVQFVPEIKTVSDTSPTANVISPERRQALVDLSRSSRIEDAVIADLTGKVSADLLQPGQLTQWVKAALQPRSEILTIQATAASPTEALLIANSWARNYVREVNRIYSIGPDPDSLIGLRDAAQTNLDTAQKALSDSLATSQLELVNLQIAQREALIGLLMTPYRTTDGSADTKTGAAAAPSGNPGLNDYRLAERRTLDDVAQTLRRVDATRQTVRALLAQSQTGQTGTSSDAAALALVKAQLVAITDGLPAQVQIQLPAAPAGDSPNELRALAATLDATRATLQTELDARRSAYEENSNRQITDLEQQLQELRTKREIADAERRRLASARDLASETFAAIVKKVEEQRVASSTTGHEVELASEASYAAPVTRNDVSRLTTPAAIGLAIAILVAYLRWYGVGPRRALEALHLRRGI